MKTFFTFFVFLIVNNFCFAQSTLHLKCEECFLGERKIHLPRNIKYVLSNDKSKTKFEAILLEEQNDTLIFTSKNHDSVFRIYWRDVKYINVERTVAGNIIYFYEFILSVGFTTASIVMLPLFVIRNEYEGYRAALMLTDIVAGGISLIPSLYLINRIEKKYSSEDYKIIHANEKKQYLLPFEKKDSIFLRPVYSNDTLKKGLSRNIHFYNVKKYKVKSYLLPIQAKFKFKNNSVVPFTATISNVTDSSIIACDLYSKLIFEILLNNLKSVEIKMTRPIDKAFYSLEGLGYLMTFVAMQVMETDSKVALSIFTFAAPTALIMHFAHKKKYNLDTYKVQKSP